MFPANSSIFHRRAATIGIALISLSLPADAQQRNTRWGDNSIAIEFTPRRTGDYNPNSDQGYCNIRLDVDAEVYIYIRGDRVRAERTSGQLPRDQGSECSGPLAGRYIRNFRWRGVDGRGEQRLIEQPSSGNNYTAVAYIRDSQGGREGYTFRIEWEGRGGSGGDWGGGGADWGGGGGSIPNGMSGNFNGRGDWSTSGNQSRQLANANVNLSRDGRFRVESSGTDSVIMEGRWRRSGNDLELQVERFFNTSVNGTGKLVARNNRLWRIQANGDAGSNNRPFVYNFTADDSGGGWGSGGSGGGWSSGGGWGTGGSGWGGSGNFTTESRGRGGAFLQGDPDRRITYVRFDVNGNNFRIQVQGDENIALSGRITRRGSNDAALDVDQINSRGASGGGSIQFRNNRISRINLTGSYNNRQYRVNFDGEN